jgi:hypothetical protein
MIYLLIQTKIMTLKALVHNINQIHLFNLVINLLVKNLKNFLKAHKLKMHAIISAKKLLRLSKKEYLIKN